ncbi:DUF2892 domain-containing protein [Vibrio pectenicida]|uniref:DUF2892 domain-containing protein n=1 Tax=Vibrio pectenicida TaxID=62763 RepID=A0A7Y4A143_9VIBR|nr:DUF2892 domain-containing protein [Vibrio pectenicida]NOH72820.1 DUF2892 domain-containing protein [Vibrio pectenicida]
MFYSKQLPFWQRTTRGIAGTAMIGCGLIGLSGLALGYFIALVGVVTTLTGVIGFCPMCSFAVRKSK